MLCVCFNIYRPISKMRSTSYNLEQMERLCMIRLPFSFFTNNFDSFIALLSCRDFIKHLMEILRSVAVVTVHLPACCSRSSLKIFIRCFDILAIVGEVLKHLGHHHDGDQTARLLHILCSIFVHSLGALAKAVRMFKA